MDVARQPHYMNQKLQPIRMMQLVLSPQEFEGFLKGNIIKYIMRANLKGGQEDLDKAEVYESWLIEFRQFDDITVPGEHE